MRTGRDQSDGSGGSCTWGPGNCEGQEGPSPGASGGSVAQAHLGWGLLAPVLGESRCLMF